MSAPKQDPPSTRFLIESLRLEPHPEGGFYAVTHINPLLIPSPFTSTSYPTPASDFPPPVTIPPTTSASPPSPAASDESRLASTSIHYLLTPSSPLGYFHRNKARTYHSWHKGKGRYTLIHPTTGHVVTFAVGGDVAAGERLQWVVEGGWWKSSILDDGEEGLLISEVLVPGFEWGDHEFMQRAVLRDLVGEEKGKELEKYLRKD